MVLRSWAAVAVLVVSSAVLAGGQTATATITATADSATATATDTTTATKPNAVGIPLTLAPPTPAPPAVVDDKVNVTHTPTVTATLPTLTATRSATATASLPPGDAATPPTPPPSDDTVADLFSSWYMILVLCLLCICLCVFGLFLSVSAYKKKQERQRRRARNEGRKGAGGEGRAGVGTVVIGQAGSQYFEGDGRELAGNTPMASGIVPDAAADAAGAGGVGGASLLSLDLRDATGRLGDTENAMWVRPILPSADAVIAPPAPTAFHSHVVEVEVPGEDLGLQLTHTRSAGGESENFDATSSHTLVRSMSRRAQSSHNLKLNRALPGEDAIMAANTRSSNSPLPTPRMAR